MLLLEYVKTVCFLTSEQAGAQISTAFGVSPRERQIEQTSDWGAILEGICSGEPPHPLAPDSPAWGSGGTTKGLPQALRTKLGFRVPETSRITTVGEKETLPTFLPSLTTERTVFLKLLTSVTEPVARHYFHCPPCKA